MPPLPAPTVGTTPRRSRARPQGLPATPGLQPPTRRAGRRRGRRGEDLDVAGLVGHLHGQELDDLAEVGVDATQEPGRHDQCRLLVPHQVGHQLHDRGPRRRPGGPGRAPVDGGRRVPLAGRRLGVELGGRRRPRPPARRRGRSASRDRRPRRGRLAPPGPTGDGRSTTAPSSDGSAPARSAADHRRSLMSPATMMATTGVPESTTRRPATRLDGHVPGTRLKVHRQRRALLVTSSRPPVGSWPAPASGRCGVSKPEPVQVESQGRYSAAATFPSAS